MLALLLASSLALGAAPLATLPQDWALCHGPESSHLDFQGVAALTQLKLKFTDGAPEGFADVERPLELLKQNFPTVKLSTQFPGATLQGVVEFGGDNAFPFVKDNLSSGGVPAISLAIGRQVAEHINAIADVSRGLMLSLPTGSLDCSSWLEGGKLRFQADMKTGFQFEISPLPAGIGQIAQVEGLPGPALPKGWEARLMSTANAAPGPNLVNLRVGKADPHPFFDVVLLHNPNKKAHQFKVDFEALGWERPKRWRIALDWTHGELLGTFRRELAVEVAGKSTTIVVVRYEMPRSIIATSLSPLSQVIAPWTWFSLSAAPSGSEEITCTYDAPKGPDGEWIALSAADNRKAPPFKVLAISDENENKLKFSQKGALLLVQRLNKDALERRYLKVFSDGRLKAEVAK